MQYCVKNKIPKIIMPICDETLYTLKMSSYLFDKYWPSQTKIDVIGFKKPDFEISSKMNFVSIDIQQKGGAKSWSKYILQYLQQVQEEQIIFTLEDFFPTKEPNLNLLNSVNQLLKKDKKIGRFDLTYDSYTYGQYNVLKNIKNLTLICKERYTDYRVSTQPSLWNKDFLIEILKNTTSPWDFEINGTKYSNVLNYQVLAFADETYNNFPTYWIHKGAVSRQCPEKINILGIDIDTIKEMVTLGLFKEDQLVWGMWSGGNMPKFHELGGYDFDLSKMPHHDSSRTNWKEYENIYGDKK